MKLTPKQKEIIDKAIELEHGPVADLSLIHISEPTRPY